MLAFLPNRLANRIQVRTKSLYSRKELSDLPIFIDQKFIYQNKQIKLKFCPIDQHLMHQKILPCRIKFFFLSLY
jgi:hypothetical protein